MKKVCLLCKNKKPHGWKKFCSMYCSNSFYKTVSVTGYKKCLYCKKKFPYRNTAKVRSSWSVIEKRMVGSIRQKYCSQKCALDYRNRYKNPSQDPIVRKKMSVFAKKRGTAYLQTSVIREKQRLSITKENHWNWQGGKTELNKRLRNTAKYREWRRRIFTRDNWTCKKCGVRNLKGLGESIKLQADHIKPWSLFPKYRYSLSNGRTLCLKCHKNTDTYMGRIKKYKQLAIAATT